MNANRIDLNVCARTSVVKGAALRIPAILLVLCYWAVGSTFAQDTYTDSWGTDHDGEYGQYASVDGAGVTDSEYQGGGAYWIDTSFYAPDGQVMYERGYGDGTGATSFVSYMQNVDSVREGNYDIYSDHYYTPDNSITGIEHVSSTSFLGAISSYSQSYEYVGSCITYGRPNRFAAWCYSFTCSLPSSACHAFTTPYAVLRGIRISIRLPFFSVRACIGKWSGSTWLPPCR